jgi:hypothetical protein
MARSGDGRRQCILHGISYHGHGANLQDRSDIRPDITSTMLAASCVPIAAKNKQRIGITSFGACSTLL